MIRLEVGERVGRYAPLRRLDSGLYVARDPDGPGRVVLKWDERPLGAEVVRRWSACKHPNLVGLRERVASERGLWLVLEYVEAPTLADWLQQASPAPEDALTLVLGVVQGVAALHEVGVVHRDLKAQNLLMGRGWPLPVPLVADPGLAACVGDPAEGPLGTPGWMAPEQGRVPVDPRLDVYALGVLLERVLGADAPRALVQRCLAADPAERPPDAGALRGALERLRPQPEKGS